MTDVDTLLIERDCLRLVTEYCHLVDHDKAALVADLFTDDGVWSSSENTMNGRVEIERGFRRRQDNARRMSRHVCNNFLLTIEDETRATGVVYLTLYRYDGEPGRSTSPVAAPTLVGEYRDRFVRTPAGWRIARRDVVVSFAGRAG